MTGLRAPVIHLPMAPSAHTISITDEAWKALEQRYGARGRSEAIERMVRTDLGLPPLERDGAGGTTRFTSEQNPQKKRRRSLDGST